MPELTPANCQAVTGNPAAPELLSGVYRRNLFLSALTPDAQNGPFRYHDQYYAIRGQVEAAAPWLAQAAARFREEGDELGEIEILAASAMTDTLNTAEIVNAFRQKITIAGHLLRPDQWSIYHAAEQWHAIAIQDWPALTTHLRASITRILAKLGATTRTEAVTKASQLGLI